MDQNLSNSSSDVANEEFWDLANSSSDEELMNLEIAALQEKGRRRRWGSIPGRIYKDGALDGGLDSPHSDKRFAGFSKDNKQLDAEVHRKYIYGGHVAAYMRTLMEDEPEKYQSHFSEYIKKGIVADNIEEIYKKVHAAIRADPAMKKSEKPQHSEHKSIISIVSLN